MKVSGQAEGTWLRQFWAGLSQLPIAAGQGVARQREVPRTAPTWPLRYRWESMSFPSHLPFLAAFSGNPTSAFLAIG